MRSRLMVTILVLGLALPWATGAWSQPQAALLTPPTPQFDVLGFIQEATLDTAFTICTPPKDPVTNAPSPRLAGGTMTVNGIKMIVPCNTILQLPATAMTWADLFDPAKSAPVSEPASSPSGSTLIGSVPAQVAGQTRLALADNPMAFPSFEVRAQGNVVNGKYLVGLIIPITQQGLNAGSGLISYIDHAIGAFRVGGIPNDPACTANGITSPLCSGALVQINDPDGRWGKRHSPDPRFTSDTSWPTVHASTGIPVCIPRVAPPAIDPECPLGNRPLNGDPRFPIDSFLDTGAPLKIFDMPPPPGATGADPTGFPDARKQVPMMVGDQVNYAGTLYKIDPTKTLPVPVTVTGTVPVTVTTSVTLTGTVPVTVTSTVPVTTTGAVAVTLTGTVPVTLTNSASVTLTGTVPVTLTGTVPVTTTGAVAVALAGTVPVTLTGPATVTGTVPVTLTGPATVPNPDNTPANTYISAHTVEDVLGIFTAPGINPAYVSIEDLLIGTNGAAVQGILQEASTRLTVVGFTTDPSRLVDINAIDVNPCTGAETERLLATTDPATQPMRGRFVHRVLGGLFMPPTREYVVRLQRGDYLDTSTGNEILVANGLQSGRYTLPNFEYIFPENHRLGDPLVPFNFQDLPFLALGSGPLDGAGPIVGQLNPWPGIPAPTPVNCAAGGAAPIVNAGPDIAVRTGSLVTLAGTVTLAAGSTPTILWTQSSVDPVQVTLANPTTLTPSFTAPNVPTTLSFQLRVTDQFGTGTDTVSVTVFQQTDLVQITLASWAVQKGQRGGFGKLAVTATTSDPTALLSLTEIAADATGTVVEWGTGTGSPTAPGTFDWRELKGAPQPKSLIVRSTKGGSYTATCGQPDAKGVVTCQ